MGVAQTLLQPDHCLAIRGKAKMTRLDNPGMHWADRDLVQAFAFGGKERLWFLIALRPGHVCQGVAQVPLAMIEPGPMVGQTYGFKAEEIPERALPKSFGVQG